MGKKAFAETTLAASPSEVSNALVSMMWASRITVTGQTIEEQPLRITLYGENKASFRSWGEFIRITIVAVGNESRVQAQSESKLPTTIFDYGQNKENLLLLFNQLIMKFRGTSPLTIEEKIF
ncbi:MAG: hypothetical protein NWE98_07860 [Candidatus Bathyarchaeota archaeon]|nr:hypothetical protein [Candidatus Bathyarchaeota archaeon]